MPRPKLDEDNALRSQKDVADILGMTTQSVSVIERRALKKMRAEWERLDRIEKWKAIEAKEKYRCNSPNSSPTRGSHA